MGVFQKTVFKEFVARQNQDEISLAYQKFQEHFGNPDIQTNILEAKEEQYQEGFLKDLFVNILGYTLFPQENYNLQSEIKNPNDAKKADAAIIFQEKVSAVIELKSTKTPLLKMIEAQAFGYKNQHQNCRYVITSNFRLLGFYLDNAYEFEEFDLFELNLQQFGALYTILHRKNLEKGLPIELKQKSIEREQELTLAFYNDYQGFKDALFLNIAQINKQFDKLLLFEKTQKLLDRVVFMCFAEDKGLLPANLIKTIIAEFENLKELENYVPLYDRFKAHFRYIDQGFKNKYYDIYAYNGGLFAFDEVLDAIKISDEVLESRSQWISRYDFESDIDVNVLGHIFEHSLNELDEKRQELTQEKPINTKRKKDGVFYTPLLITNYMIEESLGKMCQDKQKTLDFEHLDLEKVQNYRNWLLNLRILDPACGSGAFLNQVLTFLLAEHKRVDGLETQISGKIVSSELAHKILENNIFGVDINFESVEITKLSLWLRIAHGKKKLNDLSENIKIGNSLIDDKAVDAKAFDWQKEFPKTVGGFDLIVGNPPYGAFLKPNIKKYLEKNYALVPDFESYYYFISKGLALLKAEGKISMIVPNTFLANHFAQNYRKNLLEKYSILALIDLSELDIFAEANVRNCIFLFKKDKFEVLTKFSTYLSKEKEINTDKYLNESYLSENLANWLTLFTISKEVYAVIKKM
ncbi:MAG: restriction endonuclease subunit M, partial [Bacteroidetes bacterium]